MRAPMAWSDYPKMMRNWQEREKACKERAAALATLKRLNVDVSGLQDPHGMWAHADKWVDR